MRTLTTNQQTHLATSRQYIIADLYTFTLNTGVVYKWTTYDADVSGFSHGGPVISRTGARFAAGKETSTVDITLEAAGFMLGSRRLPLAAAQGVFEAATVKIERLYMPTPGDTSLGAFPWFEGTVSEAAPSSTGVKLTVKSRFEYLSRPMPHRVIQPSCPHILYSTACGAAKASFSYNMTVVNRNTTTIWFSDGVARADGFYQGGLVEFTSGELKGQVRMVVSHIVVDETDAYVVFDTALPSIPAIGDAFTISLGCNKMLRDAAGNPSDCITKFNRATNFGGFPFVPKPESMR